MLFIVIGLFLLVTGGAGLLITNVNLVSGDIDWILGNLIFATFTIIGFILFVTLIVTSWRE